MPRQPAASSGKLLVGRDLTEISAGLAELPGNWRLDTTESITGGAESARILPPRGSALPHFAFARREGFIILNPAVGDCLFVANRWHSRG